MTHDHGRRPVSGTFVPALLAALAVALTGPGAAAQTPAEARGPAVLPRTTGGTPPPKLPGQATTAPAQAPVTQTISPVPDADAPPTPEDVQASWALKSNFEGDPKCVSLPLNARISVDFEEAPLYDVVKFMACITRRNFIVASNIKQGKTITILSTAPVTVYEAYKAFLSSLDVNGLTLVPAGPFYKIIETAKAKTEIVPFYGAREDVPAEDRMVTRIIMLKHIDVKDIEAILAKFKTAAGDISSYAPGNSLIVTDMGRNVVRMLKFIDELDVPTGREKIWVRPVQYASATDMANLITTLFGDKAGGTAARPAPRSARRGQQPAAPTAPAAAPNSPSEGAATVSKVIADERSNQLILVATPSAYLKIDRLLRRMDMPIEGEGQIHIYYLENATAEDVASTLSSLTSGTGAAAKGKAGAAAGGAASLFSGEVKITAHKSTNSLVIESTLKDYMALKRVIQQLDVRRKQVYVEAVIMEISSNKDRKIGISGSGGTTFNIDGNTVPMLLGMGGLGISGLDMQQLTSGGIAAGLQGPLVDVSTGTTGSSATSGALSIPSYGFLIQAVQSNSDINVLSTPHILTMDNEEAEIVVGKQIPYQASSTGGLQNLLGSYGGLASSALSGVTGGATSSLMSSLGGLGGYGGYGGYGAYVQRIDVDLTLKITPQISESNFVRLKIDHQLDDVEALDTNLGPTTSKRKVSNTVVVRDQQPVVIGGLIRDIEVTGVDKVPFLGDIPVLGQLFRTTARRVEKRNLLMVITPYIIEDPSDLHRIHQQKMDEMREFAEYMSTRKAEYSGEVDYRKKHGVLEDIRRTMERVRKDRELLEQTRFDDVDRVGAPESHDLDFDPFGEPEGSAVEGGTVIGVDSEAPPEEVLSPTPAVPEMAPDFEPVQE